MGFTNPQWTWNELEARLSGRASQRGRDGRAPGSPAWNAGGDAPAWSRQRQPFEAPVDHAAPRGIRVPYAELHARSHFSFLEGASHPEALAVEASRLGLDALGLCDRDGLYGVIRFAEAARSLQLPTVIGTELTLPKDADDEEESTPRDLRCTKVLRLPCPRTTNCWPEGDTEDEAGSSNQHQN